MLPGITYHFHQELQSCQSKAVFGGSLVDDNVKAEAVGEDIMTSDPDMSSRTTGDEIDQAGRVSHRILKGRLGHR